VLPFIFFTVIVPSEIFVEDDFFIFVYTFEALVDFLPFQPRTTGPKYSPLFPPAVLTNWRVEPAIVLTRDDLRVTFCVVRVTFIDDRVCPFADTSNTVRFLPPLTVALTENVFPALDADASTGATAASDATTAAATAATDDFLISGLMTDVSLWLSHSD
jgi:hypothetical protein